VLCLGKMARADAKKKAQKASNAMRGSGSTKSVKKRYKARFYKPVTKKGTEKRKYARKTIIGKQVDKFDKYAIIKAPVTSETAMKRIEDHNTMVFIVDIRANKIQIKKAVSDLYGIQAAKVNTLIRPDGKKKAYVKLTVDHDALEAAHKLQII